MPQSDTFFCLSIKHFLNATSDISFEIVFDLSKTGVLVAISIPIFTSQLEKAREATDLANIRAAYAEVSADALTDDKKDHTATVTLVQSDKTKWTTDNNTTIAGVKLSDITITSGTVEVKYAASTGKVTIANKETSSNYSVTNSETENPSESSSEKSGFLEYTPN